MVPEITDEQRLAALEKAKEARRARHSIRVALKAGALDPLRALAMKDAAGMRVRVFLTSLPGVGGATADEALRVLGIAPSRRIGGLGCRQVERLTDWIVNREH